MSVTKLKMSQSNHPYIGMWHIYEMEMWDEDYFNMETQAYIEITPNNGGDFQFGLVSGGLDGYLEKFGDQERFTFTWSGQDEMDEASGSGWVCLSEKDEIDGMIAFHMGDRSKFKARREE
jgi:hypothetical protein